MTDIYVSIIVFVIINLCYLVIILNKRNLKKYINKSREVNLIKKKYDLDLDKINHKRLAFTLGLSNAFIISITYYAFIFIKNVILRLGLSFILLIILSLVVYTLIGKHYRKEMKK